MVYISFNGHFLLNFNGVHRARFTYINFEGSATRSYHYHKTHSNCVVQIPLESVHRTEREIKPSVIVNNVSRELN